MQNFMIFENPAFAQLLRDAGIAVFAQRSCGNAKYAARNTEQAQALLAQAKGQFGKFDCAVVPYLCF